MIDIACGANIFVYIYNIVNKTNSRRKITSIQVDRCIDLSNVHLYYTFPAINLKNN